MTYGLPAIGEESWGQKVIDSVDAVKTTAETAASTTTPGRVELATNAESVTGTDTARAVTPANLVATDADAASALRVQQDARHAATFVRRATATSPAVGALVAKLGDAVLPGYLLGLGDSTMSNSVGWFNLGVAWLAAQFPAYSVTRRDWSHTNQRYEPVPVIVQTGTAGERGFVGTGSSNDRVFTVADSAATSPSTELRAEFDVKIAALGAAFDLGGKYLTTTNNRSWFVQVSAGGTLSLYFSTDGTSGTQYTRTATAAIPGAAIGVRARIRVDWKGNDGAGNNVTTFWYSLDKGATWTQIGATVTTATAAATIFDGTSSTQLNARGGSANSTGGVITYYGMQVRTSLTTGARPVIDFDTAQWSGYYGGVSGANFYGFSGEPVVVTGLGSTGAMAGAPVLYVLNGAVSGQTISYANDGTRFPKLAPFAPDLAVINFSHNEVGLVAYRTPYKTLGDALLALGGDTGIVATIQNQEKSPASNITEHAIRGSQIRALAGSQRYAVVDIAGAFRATGDVAGHIQADGVHPTLPTTYDGTSGYEVAAAEFEAIFAQWLRPAA